MDSCRSQAMEMGAHFFHSKPIGAAGLADAIKQLQEKLA
jgi:hypothetical protein